METWIFAFKFGLWVLLDFGNNVCYMSTYTQWFWFFGVEWKVSWINYGYALPKTFPSTSLKNSGDVLLSMDCKQRWQAWVIILIKYFICQRNKWRNQSQIIYCCGPAAILVSPPLQLVDCIVPVNRHCRRVRSPRRSIVAGSLQAARIDWIAPEAMSSFSI